MTQKIAVLLASLMIIILTSTTQITKAATLESQVESLVSVLGKEKGLVKALDDLSGTLKTVKANLEEKEGLSAEEKEKIKVKISTPTSKTPITKKKSSLELLREQITQRRTDLGEQEEKITLAGIDINALQALDVDDHELSEETITFFNKKVSPHIEKIKAFLQKKPDFKTEETQTLEKLFDFLKECSDKLEEFDEDEDREEFEKGHQQTDIDFFNTLKATIKTQKDLMEIYAKSAIAALAQTLKPAPKIPLTKEAKETIRNTLTQIAGLNFWLIIKKRTEKIQKLITHFPDVLKLTVEKVNDVHVYSVDHTHFEDVTTFLSSRKKKQETQEEKDTIHEMLNDLYLIYGKNWETVKDQLNPKLKEFEWEVYRRNETQRCHARYLGKTEEERKRDEAYYAIVKGIEETFTEFAQEATTPFQRVQALYNKMISSNRKTRKMHRENRFFKMFQELQYLVTFFKQRIIEIQENVSRKIPPQTDPQALKDFFSNVTKKLEALEGHAAQAGTGGDFLKESWPHQKKHISPLIKGLVKTTAQLGEKELVVIVNGELSSNLENDILK